MAGDIDGNESFTDDGLGLGAEELLDDTGPGDPDIEERINSEYDGRWSEYNIASAERDRSRESNGGFLSAAINVAIDVISIVLAVADFVLGGLREREFLLLSFCKHLR